MQAIEGLATFLDRLVSEVRDVLQIIPGLVCQLADQNDTALFQRVQRSVEQADLGQRCGADVQARLSFLDVNETQAGAGDRLVPRVFGPSRFKFQLPCVSGVFPLRSRSHAAEVPERVQERLGITLRPITDSGGEPTTTTSLGSRNTANLQVEGNEPDLPRLFNQATASRQYH